MTESVEGIHINHRAIAVGETRHESEQFILRYRIDIVGVDLRLIGIAVERLQDRLLSEAQSIKLIQDALATSPDYIEYVKWNKWDGKLPTVLGGDSGTILDIGNITDSGQTAE